jgi:hypothetical protein
VLTFADENPVPDMTVEFVVSGSVTTTGSCKTDTTGTCMFSYEGPDFPGADEIHAYVDQNRDRVHDIGEATAEAAKAWTIPVTTQQQVTGSGQTMSGLLIKGVTFGFNAKRQGQNAKRHCNVIDHVANVKLRCLDVTSVVQVGQRATLFGNALINGVATEYRIDVVDFAEPGNYRDTFVIQTRDGYSAGGVVTNGNVQVRPQK